MEGILYTDEPQLYQPDLVLGFEGWPNAGEVSSFAVEHLVDLLRAKRFATLPLEKFNPTGSTRPMAVIREGRLVDLKFPGNHFYYSRNPASRDLILFRGVEPQSHWGAFAGLLLDLAGRFGVSRIFTLGGTFDYVPHTYPPVVSTVFNHEDLRPDVVRAGLSLTDYTGPISIHTFLLRAARKKGIKGISLWGHSPQYIQTRNIRVAHAVLKKFLELEAWDLDLSDLERECEDFDRQVKDLVSQDPKLVEAIGLLEQIYLQSGKALQAPKDDDDSKKEDKVIYIRGFLKKQEDEEKK